MEIVPLIFIVLLVGALLMFAHEIYQQKQPKSKPVPLKTVTKPKTSLAVPPQLPIEMHKGVPLPPLGKKVPTVSHNKRTRELFGQLVKLVHGDSNAANRLAANQRIKNPDKSEEWILEKVIDDLTRDRRH